MDADPKCPIQDGRSSAFHAATCSASEYRGTRCPICFWALYDGDWCQGPKWCANRGKSVEKPIRLTNSEAAEMIRHYCPTCGRHAPCRHCEPNKAWGESKGITGPNGKGTLLGQLSKTQEELTETRDAAVKLESAIEHGVEHSEAIAICELTDGIGDTVVTLILAAEMAGLDFQECVQAAYDEIAGRTGTMVNGVFVKDK